MNKKLSIHSIKHQLVDFVEYMGLNRSTEDNYDQSLRIDVKISGKAYCGSRFDKNHNEIDVSGLVLRFQSFCYSNYKAIYLHIPEPTINLMYPDMEALQKGVSARAFEYIESGWIQEACHDSCWTSGFDLDRFEINSMTIEKIQLQKANLENYEEKNSHDIRTAIFNGDVTVIKDFKCPNTENCITFYSDIMNEFGNRERGFRITIANYNSETYDDVDLIAFKKHDGFKLYFKRFSEEEQRVIVTIGDFTKDFMDSIISDCYINFFTASSSTERDFLACLMMDVENGFEVSIQKSSI